MKSSAIVPKIVLRTEELPAEEDPASPRIGRWYWVGNTKKKKKKDDRWLGCVTHVGSNYVELEGPDTRSSSHSTRVHADEFWDHCEHVPNPERVLGERVAHHQMTVKALMREIHDVTARLAIQTGPELGGMGVLPETAQSSETRALALRPKNEKGEQDLGKYKKALVLAQKKTLPDLFEEIREHNDSLSVWLSASIIPLKAQAAAMGTATSAIEDRIFSVELYAGLVETVTLIKDGEPAALTDKIHLFQRKAYMDEECLAQYETGGMEFKNLRDFDKWLARPSNMERLLPFPRSMLAFQVRRKEKEREWENLRGFLGMLEAAKSDKFTYLYFRNGEKLYRLSTEIEFGEKLFPDMERSKLSGKVWAKMFADDVKKLVSDDEYQEIVRKEEEEERKIAEMPETERHWHHYWPEAKDYEPFTRESVHYDDISKFIKGEADKHNRLVLILQGLLDRSTTFHPHPPWQLWQDGGFGQALTLVYDDTRALAPGDALDFLAYQKSLNDKLEPGSITVGQEDHWERVEAERESKRMDSNWRTQSRDWRPTKYRPEGDPGPGKVARVTRVTRSKKGGSLVATFAWARSKRRDSWRGDDEDKTVPCSIAVPASRLLNVSAYKPGDFKKFFSDPRTRADYLQWAPMLLEAEEYCAGNREVREPTRLPKREPSPEGQWKYKKQKARKASENKAVRLSRKIYMGDGKTYDKGTLWRTGNTYQGKFTLYGIDAGGKDELAEEGSTSRYARHITHVDLSDFTIDASVTLQAKQAKEA